MADFPREELQRRLEELAKSEPPRDLSVGAMCYELTGPPDVAEYLCPVCGQKTWYALEPKPKSFWNRLAGRFQSHARVEYEAALSERGAGMTRVLPRDTGGHDCTGLVEYELPYFRQQLRECGAEEFGIGLDESEFCEQCRPGITSPKVVLFVRNREGERRVEGIAGSDVQLLAEFLQGKKKHVADFGREVPLKEHARRLAELLGLDASPSQE